MFIDLLNRIKAAGNVTENDINKFINIELLNIVEQINAIVRLMVEAKAVCRTPLLPLDERREVIKKFARTISDFKNARNKDRKALFELIHYANIHQADIFRKLRSFKYDPNEYNNLTILKLDMYGGHNRSTCEIAIEWAMHELQPLTIYLKELRQLPVLPNPSAPRSVTDN